MKLLLAAILTVQIAILGVLVVKPSVPHYAWQDAPVVHGPWEKYAEIARQQ